MKKIRVVVHGASGRMGQEIINTLCQEPDMQVVGAVDVRATQDYLTLPEDLGRVPFSDSLESILGSYATDVVVDFTTAKATVPAVRTAAEKGVNMVIGTTGLTTEDIDEIKRLATARKIGVMIAPNFALGAVLMIHLAKIAAKYFDFVEIIELHHHLKADLPSGTALATARAMAQARGKSFSIPQVRTRTTSEGRLKASPFTVCACLGYWHTRRSCWGERGRH